MLYYDLYDNSGRIGRQNLYCSAFQVHYIMNLGLCGKLTSGVSAGDQLAIAKETGRRLGMGTNMYPSSSLLGHGKDEATEGLPVEELIEKADGFAGVFPGMLQII